MKGRVNDFIDDYMERTMKDGNKVWDDVQKDVSIETCTAIYQYHRGSACKILSKSMGKYIIYMYRALQISICICL